MTDPITDDPMMGETRPTLAGSAMSEPHQPGYLSFGPLTLPLQNPRPCPRCQQDPRVRRWNEVCAVCRADADYQAARKRKVARTKRQNFQRRKAGTTQATGRPRKPIGGAYS